MKWNLVRWPPAAEKRAHAGAGLLCSSQKLLAAVAGATLIRLSSVRLHQIEKGSRKGAADDDCASVALTIWHTCRLSLPSLSWLGEGVNDYSRLLLQSSCLSVCVVDSAELFSQSVFPARVVHFSLRVWVTCRTAVGVNAVHKIENSYRGKTV